MGDSKTASTTPNSWVGALQASLSGATGNTWQMSNIGVDGTTVATYLGNITANLSAVTGVPSDYKMVVLCNWGANDIPRGLPAEATWEANYEAIIDAVLAKWPIAKIYLMRPWLQGGDTGAATLHSWIAVVQAARSASVSLGPDEAVWLKGADNGASETTDGIHYSTLGESLCAAQWKSTLGY